jgi:hypothetical protein
MLQKGDVVAGYVQVALVNVGNVRQSIQVGERGTVGIMDYLFILAIRDARYFRQRRAIGEFHDRPVKFAPDHEIDCRSVAQRLLGQGADMRADEGDLEPGVGGLDRRRKFAVTAESRGGSEQYQEFILLADRDRFLGAHVMRRSVEQAGAFQHAGRIGQPDGIPVGFDFAGGGPTRAGASIEIFEGRRIQQ